MVIGANPSTWVPQQTYDLVLIHLSLVLCRSVTGILQTAFAACRPGGRLVVSLIYGPATDYLYAGDIARKYARTNSTYIALAAQAGFRFLQREEQLAMPAFGRYHSAVALAFGR